MTIARLTFLEVSKKKIFLFTLLLTLAFALLYGIGLKMVAQEMANSGLGKAGGQLIIKQVIGNQILGAGLYFSTFLLSLLAIMASVGSIAAEVESGLLHAVVSKPISRWEVVLGKFIGYGSMLVAYGLFLFLYIIGINMYYNGAAMVLLTAGNFVQSLLIYCLQPLLLLGLSLVFSTRLKTMTAGILSVMIYGLGVIGGFLEQIGSVMNKQDLIDMGIATSLAIPSDALFRKLISVVTGSADNPLGTLASGPFGVASPPSDVMLIYSLIYTLVCILMAVFLFERQDL